MDSIGKYDRRETDDYDMSTQDNNIMLTLELRPAEIELTVPGITFTSTRFLLYDKSYFFFLILYLHNFSFMVLFFVKEK